MEEKGMDRREMRFEIADHFTVQTVKEIFSKKTDQDSSFEPTMLTDNDKLVLNNEDLDENEKVAPYSLAVRTIPFPPRVWKRHPA